MARRFVTNLDLNGNQLLNAIAQVLAADPTIGAGKFYYHSGTKTFRFQTDTETVVLGRLDQISPPAANVSMNGHRIVNLADPTGDTDGANKRYVDGLSAGLAWKEPVRVATTANVALATGTLLTIDGVVLAAGDRVLVKAQTAGAENGIYIASAGAWTRAADADSAGDLEGAAVFVNEGAAAGDTGWVMTTNPPITLGTTALTFVKFFGGTTGSVNKFAADIGDGVATSIAVVHNLGSRDVTVSVRDVVSHAEVYPDVVMTDANTVTLGFTTAPATGSLRAVVIG